MTTTQTSLKQRIASGEPLLGTFLKTPSAMICEVLGRTSFDLVCIDAEHAPFDRRDIDSCIHALRSTAMPCLVRLPASEATHILTALDCGADGVLAPHIGSAAQAQFLVDHSLYGRGRGFAASSRAAGYTAKPMAAHKADSNASTVVLAQIEDVDALDNLDAILAVQDIDCFFVGRADLTIAMGLEDTNHPQVVDAVADVCTRASAAGQRVGMFLADIEEIPKWRALGASLFLLSSDHAFILQGAATFNKSVREKF